MGEDSRASRSGSCYCLWLKGWSVERGKGTRDGSFRTGGICGLQERRHLVYSDPKGTQGNEFLCPLTS